MPNCTVTEKVFQEKGDKDTDADKKKGKLWIFGNQVVHKKIIVVLDVLE
jgi:hypothetical protein